MTDTENTENAETTGTAGQGAPEMPHTPRNVWDNPYEVELSWEQDGEATSWMVAASTPDGSIDQRSRVRRPKKALTDVPVDQPLTVEITAERGGEQSAPLRLVFPPLTQNPPDPQDLVVTPEKTSLALHWSQPDPQITQAWQVSWKDSRITGNDPTKLPSGTIDVFGVPSAVLTGLTPGTSYDIVVAARYRRTGYSTGTAKATATTLGEDTKDRPSAPHTLHNQWRNPYEVDLEWAQNGRVSEWQVTASTPDGSVELNKRVPRPSVSVLDVPFEQPLTVEIRALADGVESEPLVLQFPATTQAPPAPADLKVTPGQSSLALSWTQPDPEIFQAWQVMWTTPQGYPGEPISGNVDAFGEPQFVITDLPPNTPFELHVSTRHRRSAYSKGAATATASTTGSGPGPDPQPPATPENLTVHCIADISAKAEWDNDTRVDGWEVWLDDDREHGAIATVTPLVQLKGLTPGRTYTVHVVAVVGTPGKPGYAESTVASKAFTTETSILPDDPEPGDEADLPAPSDLVVRPVNPTTVDAFWTDDRPSTKDYYVASVDGVHWIRVEDNQIRFTDLQDGRQVDVRVYGVYGTKLTGIARKGATLTEAAK